MPILPKGLLEDLRQIIDQTRRFVASTVNAQMTLLYWRVGSRIKSEVLKDERAEYGKSIVSTVSNKLALEYGTGFKEQNLRKMIRFAESFPDEQILLSLLRHLSWSHFIELTPLKEPLKRDFYAEMCRMERWNVRTLRKKISSMFYERTALSKRPELLIRAELDALRQEDLLTPNLVFHDPYILEFLQMNDRYFEKDLEDAIMREMERFLLELGIGFCFVARQKRITVDDEDFHLALLFFHRSMKRLVAVELKIGDFKPEHKGQMELYLRWLDKYERKFGEESPWDLFFAREKNKNESNY